MGQYTSTAALLLACTLIASAGCSTGGYGFRWLPSSWHGRPPQGSESTVVYRPSDRGPTPAAEVIDSPPPSRTN